MDIDTTAMQRDRKRADREVKADAYRISGMADVRTVVDIGAYHGSFSRFAKRLYPLAAVHAFEPSPDSFERLCGTTSGVSTYNYAVADAPGRVSLQLSQVPSCNALGPRPQRPTGQSVLVEAVALPGWMLQYAITRIDILKLDCEGQEAAICESLAKAGRLPQIRYITGEWHGHEQIERVGYALAETHDFEWHGIKPGRGYFYAHAKNLPVQPAL